MKITKFGGIEKVRMNEIKYSCSCDSDLAETLLNDISGDISINIQNDADKSTEINSMYHELSNKQIKDSVLKEVKYEFELSRKRLEILQTQLTTHISQLEGMMCNTTVKQTEQLSRELDKKNDILYKFRHSSIFKNFANSFVQNDIVSESSRQPPDVSKNIDCSFLNSPLQCFECDTPIISKSTFANIFQKENNVSIDLNKNISYQSIDIRKPVIKSILVQISMLLLMTSTKILKLTIMVLTRNL